MKHTSEAGPDYSVANTPNLMSDDIDEVKAPPLPVAIREAQKADEMAQQIQRELKKAAELPRSKWSERTKIAHKRYVI